MDYLAAAQIYLKTNPLLEEPLAPEHIKDRLLGHWGTAPGINLVYVHLNRLIRKTDAGVLLITGPGHGAAANMANMYIEGTLTDFYPEYTQDLAGMERFVKSFSWPYGFPSHLSPALPGVIHEGGELGYALATAFGAALDNPDLIVACIVGDGEAETGPTAASWHGNKFLSAATDGAVLPILHLNGFKIANPTISATMSEQELAGLYSGFGYAVRFVHESQRIDSDLDAALSWAYEEIRRLQELARSGAPVERPRWPMIVLRTPKGLGCPQGARREEARGVLPRPSGADPGSEDESGASGASGEVAPLVPARGTLRRRRETGGRHPVALPEARAAHRDERGELRRRPARPAGPSAARAPRRPARRAGRAMVSHMKFLSEYLKDVLQSNEKERNFRIVAPDELESNRLGGLLEVTKPPVRLASPRRHREDRPRRARARDALRAHVPGVAAGLSPDRPARPLLLLRGVRPDRGRDDEPVREVPEVRDRGRVAKADLLAQLPADLGGLAAGPQRLLPPGARASSTTS